MTPREREIRLADLAARQRRAAAAAEGLYREHLMGSIVNIILSAPDGAEAFRQIVANNPGAPQEWRDAVVAVDAQVCEEAAIERRLAEREATQLRLKADLILVRAALPGPEKNLGPAGSAPGQRDYRYPKCNE